jgi:hypothetical protein
MAVDIERFVETAFEAFLRGGEGDTGRGRGGSGRHRLGTAGAVAVGVGLGLAARTAYHRIGAIDLERAASALEERLKR